MRRRPEDEQTAGDGSQTASDGSPTAGGESPTERAGGSPPSPAAGLAAVAERVVDAGATGFVHVATGGDADRLYLTRTDRPAREAAVVVLPEPAGDTVGAIEAVYCLPAASTEAARAFLEGDPAAIEGDVDPAAIEGEIDPTGDGSDEAAGDADDAAEPRLTRRVAFRSPGTTAGSHAVAVLADRLGAAAGSGTLLAPRRIPHDAALELTGAGYTLQSTTALAEARAEKSPAERERLGAVQRAATRGLDRGVSMLAASDAVGGHVQYDGRPLSARRVEAEMRVALARAGVDAECVAVGVVGDDDGSSTAADDPRSATGGPGPATDSPLPAGEPIDLHVRARGAHGYHGRLTRTVVVDSDGGWDRRANIACAAGLAAGLRHCRPGTSVHAVRAEVVAELAAYGFEPADRPATDGSAVTPPAATGATAHVHGLGLDPAEPPRGDEDGRLRDGSVVVLETSVADADFGRVRLGTVADVDDEGATELVAYPTALTPAAIDAAAADDPEWKNEGERREDDGY